MQKFNYLDIAVRDDWMSDIEIEKHMAILEDAFPKLSRVLMD